MTHKHQDQPTKRTVLLTGLAYVMTAITGAISFLVIRPQLLVAETAPATVARLVDNESLARVGLVVELALVASGSLTALMFFALFRSVDPVAAAAVTVFGLLGSMSIMIGTIFSGAALGLATGGIETNNGSADLVVVLLELKEMAWSVGALPFGLWLIPMGWMALRSGWMPRILGVALMVGGAGYIVSAAVDQLRPEASTLVEALTAPASLAEFSMMGYLVFRGSFTKPTLTEPHSLLTPKVEVMA